jgi:hypothetical protein
LAGESARWANVTERQATRHRHLETQLAA